MLSSVLRISVLSTIVLPVHIKANTPLYIRVETSSTKLNSRVRSPGSRCVKRTRILSRSIPSIQHFSRSSYAVTSGSVREACAFRIDCSRFRSGRMDEGIERERMGSRNLHRGLR